MFERFTEDARQVIMRAQEQARAHRCDVIRTEHLLLAVASQNEGEAAKVLLELGIPLQSVRTRLDEIVGTGYQEPMGHIPFSPQAKLVLKLGFDESQELGDEHIGTEHVLLGLLREDEGA